MPLPLLGLAPYAGAAAGAIGGLAARFGPQAYAAASRFAPVAQRGIQTLFDKRTDAAATIAGLTSQGPRIAGRVGFDRAGIGTRLAGRRPTQPQPRTRLVTPPGVQALAGGPDEQLGGNNV